MNEKTSGRASGAENTKVSPDKDQQPTSSFTAKFRVSSANPKIQTITLNIHQDAGQSSTKLVKVVS